MLGRGQLSEIQTHGIPENECSSGNIQTGVLHIKVLVLSRLILNRSINMINHDK